MSLRDWFLKRWATNKGEELARNGGPVWDWIKAHRGPIGAGLAAVTTWAATQGCPNVLEQNIPALLHVSCGAINTGLQVFGALLAGAGFFKSDGYQKNKQAAAADLGSVPPVK